METILMILIMVLAPSAFLFGKYTDKFFRVKINRNFFKKEEIILQLLTKDRKSARYVTVSPTGGAFIHKGKIWFADKNEITRASVDETKVKIVDLKKVKNEIVKEGDKLVIQKSKGFMGQKQVIPLSALKFETEKGLVIQEQNLVYHEGVPVLTVDEDHLTPIPYKDVPDSVKPHELFALLDNYISIQKEKDKASQGKEVDIIGILTVLLIAVTLCLVYLTMETTNANAADIQILKANGGSYAAQSSQNIPVPQGGSVQGDKIVVN